MRVKILFLLSISMAAHCTYSQVPINFANEKVEMERVGSPIFLGGIFVHGNMQLDTKHAPANPNPSSPRSLANGAELFRIFCASCHGSSATGDGKGGEKLGTKPANLRALSGKVSDYYFFSRISNSPKGMPSWRDILSESAIWDLTNYLQSLSQTK